MHPAFGDLASDKSVGLVNPGERIDRNVSRCTKGVAIRRLDDIKQWTDKFWRKDCQFLCMAVGEIL